MKMQITSNFDEKLAELYSSKITVNLDTESKLSEEEVWNTMELIAVNHRAMINFKINR